jgi:hypothetical protein
MVTVSTPITLLYLTNIQINNLSEISNYGNYCSTTTMSFASALNPIFAWAPSQ